MHDTCRATDQVARGSSALPALEFWSLGKLLRVLETSKTAANPVEALTSCGIIRHAVASVDKHRVVSRCSAEETSQVSLVTYTSHFVSILGFLHCGDDVYNCDTLYLCDNDSKLPSYLLDPSPQVMDQLVLVKRWVLVDKTLGGVHTPNSMFLEIHDEKLVLLLPREDCYARWTQEEVLQVIESRY